MIRMFQYLFMPLASSLSNRDQILIVFKQIRANIIDISDTFASLALALAGFLIGIKLIKLSYETLSDEQGSGFGGIQLRQIIVPMVLLISIAGYKYLIGGLDYGMTVLTTHICNNGAVKKQADQNLMEITVMMDSLDNKYMTEARRIFDEAGAQYNQYTTTGNSVAPAWDAAIDQTHKELGNSVLLPGVSKGTLENKGLYDSEEDTDNAFRKEFRNLIKQYLRANAKSQKVSNGKNGVVAGLAGALFNTVYLIMQAVAELYLCIFALLGPFTLAFSVLDKWSDAWKGFAAKYIEVSFWLVVATVIDWLVSVASGTATQCALETYYNAMATLLENQMPDAYYQFGRALTATTLISIAGIIALFSVPDITSAVLSLGSGTAMGGANTGANAARTVANAPANMTKAATGQVIKGATQSKSIAKEVAKIIGKK